MPVWRTLDSKTEGGMLLLQSDLKTPPLEPQLSKGEMGAEFIVGSREIATHLAHSIRATRLSVRVKIPQLPPGPTRAALPPKPRAAPAAADSAAPAASDEPLKPEPETAAPAYRPW